MCTMLSQMDETIGQAFASKLRSLRKKSGITQQKVADELGIVLRNYVKYEAGQSFPPIPKLGDLARVMGCSVSTFFEGPETLTASQRMARVQRDLRIIGQELEALNAVAKHVSGEKPIQDFQETALARFGGDDVLSDKFTWDLVDRLNFSRSPAISALRALDEKARADESLARRGGKATPIRKPAGDLKHPLAADEGASKKSGKAAKAEELARKLIEEQ